MASWLTKPYIANCMGYVCRVTNFLIIIYLIVKVGILKPTQSCGLIPISMVILVQFDGWINVLVVTDKMWTCLGEQVWDIGGCFWALQHFREQIRNRDHNVHELVCLGKQRHCWGKQVPYSCEHIVLRRAYVRRF